MGEILMKHTATQKMLLEYIVCSYTSLSALPTDKDGNHIVAALNYSKTWLIQNY
jgi:hypothetical protein